MKSCKKTQIANFKTKENKQTKKPKQKKELKSGCPTCYSAGGRQKTTCGRRFSPSVV